MNMEYKGEITGMTDENMMGRRLQRKHRKKSSE